MPLFVAVSMIEDAVEGRIFNHIAAFVCASQDEAVEKAKADVSACYGGLRMLNGSVISLTPQAVREAYAELQDEGPQS